MIFKYGMTIETLEQLSKFEAECLEHLVEDAIRIAGHGINVIGFLSNDEDNEYLDYLEE